MTNVHLEHDPTTGDVLVTFKYDPTLVELLKNTITHHFRKWNPDAKHWAVSSLFIDEFVSAARRHGHVFTGLYADQGERQQRRTGHPRSAPPPAADWAETLLDAVGTERADAVFKALTRVLHPDTATGSTELMQQLNRARDTRKAAA